MDVELSDGVLRAVVSTRGGCLLRLDLIDGVIPLLRPFKDGPAPFHPTRAAAFPLIPFGNRLRGDGFRIGSRTIRFRPNTPGGAPYLHGDTWLGEWQVDEITSRSARLSFSRLEDDISAYSYAAEQSLSLDQGTLHLGLSVTNLGPETLPFAIGHHPYFPWRPGTQIRLGKTNDFWSEDFNYLPGRPMRPPADLRFDDFASPPRRRVNNVFDGWDGQAWIQWPDHQVMLSMRAAPELRWLMLFINTPERDPAYRFEYFCLEPMTHLPGGHDSPETAGFALLPPGMSFCTEIAYEVSLRK